MEKRLLPLSTFDEFPEQTAGYELLRYVGLPELLGHEKDTLLYFIGRNLARNIEIESLDDLTYLFKKFKWGKLELIKDKRTSLTFHLMADEVAQRIMAPIKIDFRLESGFIAEAIEMITHRTCECSESVNERLYRVQFKIVFTD